MSRSSSRGWVCSPGQYVYADLAGAVVVPHGQLDEVLAEARRIEADDARFRAQIAREELAGPVAGGEQEP